jgi:hypothetical protein
MSGLKKKSGPSPNFQSIIKKPSENTSRKERAQRVNQRIVVVVVVVVAAVVALVVVGTGSARLFSRFRVEGLGLGLRHCVCPSRSSAITYEEKRKGVIFLFRSPFFYPDKDLFSSIPIVVQLFE